MAVRNQGWFVTCDECQSNVYDSIIDGLPMGRMEALRDAARQGWAVSYRLGKALCPECANSEDDEEP